MTKSDCLKWAEALFEGKYEKLRKRMSNVSVPSDSMKGLLLEERTEPTACCCLGVLNETLKPEGYQEDRKRRVGRKLGESGITSGANPKIFGVQAGAMNDGFSGYYRGDDYGIPEEGLTHEEIGILLLFAVESGEYKNI